MNGAKASTPVVLNLTWFVTPCPFNWPIINIVTLGFCNITAELFSKSLCSCPRRTAPWPSREAEGPGWEPCFTHCSAKMFSKLACTPSQSQPQPTISLEKWKKDEQAFTRNAISVRIEKLTIFFPIEPHATLKKNVAISFHIPLTQTTFTLVVRSPIFVSHESKILCT